MLMTFLHFQFRHDSASLAERRLAGFAGPEAHHQDAAQQTDDVRTDLNAGAEKLKDQLKNPNIQASVSDLVEHATALRKGNAIEAFGKHQKTLEGAAEKNAAMLYAVLKASNTPGAEAVAAKQIMDLYGGRLISLQLTYSPDGSYKAVIKEGLIVAPADAKGREEAKEDPQSTQAMDANPDKFGEVKQDIIDLKVSEEAKLALVKALEKMDDVTDVLAFTAKFVSMNAVSRQTIMNGLDKNDQMREKLLQGKDKNADECKEAWDFLDKHETMGDVLRKVQKSLTTDTLKEDAKDLQKRAEELGKDLDPGDKDFELKVSKIMMSTGAEYKVVGNKVAFTVPEDPNDQAMNKFTGFVTFLGALVEKLQKGLKKEKGSEVAAAESGAPKRFSEKETPGKSSTKEKPTFDFELVPLKDADRENLAKFFTTKGKPVDAGKPGESLKFTDKTKQEIAEIKSLVAAFERGAAVAEEVGKTMAEFNQNNRHSELEFDQAKNEFKLKTVVTLTVPLIEERLKALGIPFEKTDGGKPFILKNNPDITKKLPEIKTKLNEPIKESLKDYQRRQLATFHEVLTQMGAPPTPIDANMTNDAIAQSIIGAINVYGRTKFNLGVASGDGDLVEVDDDPGLTNNNDIYDYIEDRLQTNPYNTIQDLANQNWTQNKDQSNWGANSKAKIPEFCRALKKAIDGVNADYVSSEPVPDNFD